MVTQKSSKKPAPVSAKKGTGTAVKTVKPPVKGPSAGSPKPVQSGGKEISSPPAGLTKQKVIKVPVVPVVSKPDVEGKKTVKKKIKKDLKDAKNKKRKAKKALKKSISKSAGKKKVKKLKAKYLKASKKVKKLKKL
jgi:hypothetical protein